MSTINNSIAVVNGKPIDKVYSNDKIVYSRNYLINKTSFPGQISSYSSSVFTSKVNGLVYDAIPTKAGDKWTVTQWLDKPWEYPNNEGGQYRDIFFKFLDKDGNLVYISEVNGIITPYPQTLSYFTSTIEVPDNDAIAFIMVSIDWMEDGRGHAKLEKGSKATDWTPAVEDVI